VTGGWPRYQVPEGWVARGWRFEVETTTLAQRPRIAQHFGARRFAYNWALAQVKANLDARAADPSVSPLAWTLPTLRKAWNQAKAEVAPWWPCCSKEAYACGIATRASPMPAAASTLASTASGRSSPTAMTRSSGWPIPPHGSRRKLAALDRRAAKLRRESVHTLTTVLARHFGTIVVEDLDVAAMARGMGRRAFRRSVYQAGIGQVRPTLAYKTSWAGNWWWPTAGWPPPRPTTAAAATTPTSGLPTGCGSAQPVGSWWTVTPTPPATSVTGPDRSATGMSSGVELPPRCRSLATTTGRLTLQAWACEAL